MAHRQRVVEHDHRGGFALTTEQVEAPWGERRTGEREREEHQREGAQQHQDQILHLQTTRVLLDGREQEVHRRPDHGLEPALVEQVDDDRNSGGAGETGEQEIEEAHQRPAPRPPAINARSRPMR